MKKKFEEIGHSAVALGKKYAPTVLLMLLVFTARAADAADEIGNVWKDEIQPILNIVTGVAAFAATIWCGIMFFTGKKTALTIGGYVLLGAVVIRVLPRIISAVSGIDFSSLFTK